VPDPDDVLIRQIKVRADAQRKLTLFYKDQEEKQKKTDEQFTQQMQPNDLVLVKAFPDDKNKPVYKPNVYRIVSRKLRNLYLIPLDGSKGIYRAHVKHCKRFYNDKLLNLLTPAIRQIFGRYYNIARREIPFAPTAAGSESQNDHQTRQRRRPSLLKTDSSQESEDSRSQISDHGVIDVDKDGSRMPSNGALNSSTPGHLSLVLSHNPIHAHLLRAQQQLVLQNKSKSNLSTVHSSKNLGVRSTGRSLLDATIHSVKQFVPKFTSTPEKDKSIMSQISDSVRNAPRKLVEILKRPLVKKAQKKLAISPDGKIAVPALHTPHRKSARRQRRDAQVAKHTAELPGSRRLHATGKMLHDISQIPLHQSPPLPEPLPRQAARKAAKALNQPATVDLQGIRRSSRKTILPKKLQDYILGSRPLGQRKAAVPDAIAEEQSP
jgi:hypothetical protein